MLTDSEFAQMRAMEEATMTENADIVSTERVRDESGGHTTVEVIQEDVPCKRWTRITGEGETQFGGQYLSGLMWMLAFPVGTTVKQDDEIVVGDDRYSVAAVMGPETYATAHVVSAIRR